MINNYNNSLSFKEALICYKDGYGKDKSVIIPDGQKVIINSTDKGFEFRRKGANYSTKASEITTLTIDNRTEVNFFNKNHKHQTLIIDEVKSSGVLNIIGKDQSEKRNENVLIKNLGAEGIVHCFKNPFVKVENILGGRILAGNNTKLNVTKNDALISAINTPGQKVEVTVDSNEPNGKIFAGGFSDQAEGNTVLNVRSNSGLLSLGGLCKCFIDKLKAKSRITADGSGVSISIEDAQKNLTPNDYSINLQKGATLTNLSDQHIEIKYSPS